MAGDGLPTSRQRALVLLVLCNAKGALHPVQDLFPQLGGKVPLPTVWLIIANLLHFELLTLKGPRDRSVGYLLTRRGAAHAVRVIRAEIERVHGTGERLLRDEAKELGLPLPYVDLYQLPDAVPDGPAAEDHDPTERKS